MRFIRRLPYLVAFTLAVVSVWNYWVERYTPAIFFVLLAMYVGSL